MQKMATLISNMQSFLVHHMLLLLTMPNYVILSLLLHYRGFTISNNNHAEIIQVECMQEKGMTEEASLVFALLALAAAAKAQVDLFSGTMGWMMMVVAVKTTCIRAPHRTAA